MSKMKKTDALELSLELTKIALAQAANLYPNKGAAESVADFIEELTKRLSEVDLE